MVFATYISRKKKREVAKMKKMINCANWNEYDGLNGPVAFCKKGAYGIALTTVEAISCGCTELKRAACLKAMTASGGFGLVSEIAAELPVEVSFGRRGELIGLLG
jgi:hypothetical protein